jgi:dihydrofolate reductase
MTSSNINIVVAVALNGVIGDSKTNQMPWNIPSDLKHFKSLTLNKTVVMGRRTFESIGKPLPNRRNIVITSDPQFKWRHKVQTYSSVLQAMANETEDLYAIGGQRIFEEVMKDLLPTTFYVTLILAKPPGDIKFPSDGYSFNGRFYIPQQNFILYHLREESEWMEENGFKFKFTEFSRNVPRTP